MASEMADNLSPSLKSKMAKNKDFVWKKDLGKDEKDWTKQAYGTCQTLFKDTEKTDQYKTEFEFRTFKAE